MCFDKVESGETICLLYKIGKEGKCKHFFEYPFVHGFSDCYLVVIKLKVFQVWGINKRNTFDVSDVAVTKDKSGEKQKLWSF
jgi:hypothetical protein